MQLQVLRAPSVRRRAKTTATCSRPAARLQVVRIERLAEQLRLALGRRQQAGQHLHGRRLAAAVRAEKAENLAVLDVEADVVDGGEIAEALGQPVGRDGDRPPSPLRAAASRSCAVAAALFFRQQLR